VRVAPLALLALVGCAHASAAPAASPAPTCDGRGLAAPLRPCSEAAPCERALDFSEGFLPHTVKTSSDAPVCATPRKSGTPSFDDGLPLQLAGVDGLPRYACVHAPAPRARLPLVLWFHGSGGDATGVYGRTLLRAKSDGFDLSGDPARKGFVLAAPQGRNLHWAGKNPAGRHWDHYFRQMDQNADVAFVDALVDRLVAEGAVDPARIYAVGWSNGGRFAQFYGLERSARPTPGGNRVAAAVSYAGASPLASPDAALPGCAEEPIPSTTLPVLLNQRDCDGAMGCDAQQAADFGLPPGSDLLGWSRALAGAGAGVTVQLIDAEARPTSGCSAHCGRLSGLKNHLRWPDGVDDGSGRDLEPALLEFLRNHPSSAPRPH
jgi:dienelactone hydrolase